MRGVYRRRVMGAFNVAVAVPEGANVEAGVAAAMDPHRHITHNWYAIGGYDWPAIAAYVDPDGNWIDGPPPAGVPTIIVRCKG